MLLNIRDNWSNATIEHQDFFQEEILNKNHIKKPRKIGEKLAKNFIKKHESNLACGNQLELEKIAREYKKTKDGLKPQEQLDFETT